MKIASILILFGTNVFAQTANQEIVCNAQCVYVNPQTNVFLLGEPMEGWSTYSDTEAFYDLSLKCQYPYQLVQSIAGYKNTIRDSQTDTHATAQSGSSSASSGYKNVSIDKITPRKIKGINVVQGNSRSNSSYSSATVNQSIHIHTEDQFEFDVKFANPKESCRTSIINPNGGRRYINGHPIGG